MTAPATLSHRTVLQLSLVDGTQVKTLFRFELHKMETMEGNFRLTGISPSVDDDLGAFMRAPIGAIVHPGFSTVKKC